MEMTPAEERAIRETVREMQATWNRHDMKAYAALLTEDADWVNIVGMWWQGKTDVYRAHEAFHETSFRNVSIHVDHVSVRKLSADVAVAVCTERVDAFTTPSGQARPKSQDRLSLILKKTGERWLICHAHNTVIDAEAAQPNPIRS
jgi:uncharacterized protein (TIGR02246 family)